MARHFANDARDPDRARDPHRPQGPARRALPRPRARRPHGALPRPRPARDRHQPADDQRQPGRARRRVPAGADRGQPARRDPGRVGLVPAPSGLRRLRRRARADALARLPHARLRQLASTAPTSSSALQDRDGAAVRARATGSASSRRWSPTAATPRRRSTRRATSSSGSSPRARSTRCCATPSRSTSKAILERGEVLIVAGAKAAVGEDNTILVTQLLLQLLHRALQAQQELPERERRRVSLLIDEAHNVLTPSVAKMLAEGRSAGLEAVFAWQYSAQIRDEVIRSGVRSLLQSISIFRMREMEDARSLAGLAMEVYSDRISIDQDEQERLRFSPDDIVKLPIHRAINLWVADGVPRAGFLGHTLPMEALHDASVAEHHREAQRERGGHHPEHAPRPARRRRRRSRSRPRARERRRSATPARRTSRERRRARGRATAAATRDREDSDGLSDGPELPASYLEAHRYDGAAIQHDRRDAIVPCALQPRDVAIVRDVWRYKFLTAPQLLELWWPDGVRPGRRPPPAASSSDAGYLDRFRPYRAPRNGLFPGPTTSARRATACCSTPASSRDRQRYRHRPIYDYGHVLHELQLNAWVLAYRRALGDGSARLGRRDRRSSRPPRPAPRARALRRRLVTPKASRRPRARPVCPDAVARDRRRRARRAQPADPHRVRPHPPPRQELREVPPLRRLPDLVVAPHAARRPRTRRRSSSSSARTTTSATHFLAAADRELTGHRWHPDVAPERYEYVGRQRILFATELDAHAAVLEARRVPAFPAGHQSRRRARGGSGSRWPRRARRPRRAIGLG